MTEYATPEDHNPVYTAGGRVREPVSCPICAEPFVVKAELQQHLETAHRVKTRNKTRKAKTKRAKYQPTRKEKMFSGGFFASAAGLLLVMVLTGLYAPGLLWVFFPAGLLLLGLTQLRR